MTALVFAVHSAAGHGFSKAAADVIELVAGHGVRGDAHSGVTVKHRSRVAKDPTQPNLRQVHLLAEELLVAVNELGFSVSAGDLGENITTRGIDLLGLGTGTRLRLGPHAIVEVTGLRNPCAQIESFRPGLLGAVRVQKPDGSVIRKAGVMAIVVEGGPLRSGDPIEVIHSPDRFVPLQPV